MHEIGNSGVWSRRDDIAAHDLADSARMRSRIFIGKPACSQQEFEPARMAWRRARLRPAQEVTLCDDADDLAFGTHDRQAADAMLQHQARPLCDCDRCCRRDRDHAAGHNFRGFMLRSARFWQSYGKRHGAALIRISQLRPFSAFSFSEH
jgi:hypothetical protein